MKKILPYLLSLLLTLCCITIHFSGGANSMLNNKDGTIANAYLTIAVKLHKESSAFKKRPLTTFIIEKTAQVTPLKIGEVFIILNLFLLFLSGILLFYLSQLFLDNPLFSLVNVLVYFVSFSNLFAFFPPIYTYDEPLQFCLILLSFICLKKGKWMLFILFFSFSLIARESGLILIPALLLIVNFKKGSFQFQNYLNKKVLLHSIYLFIPVIVYFIFLKIYLTQNNIVEASKSDFSNRLLALPFNFHTATHAIESIVSLLLVVSLPCYFLYSKINQKSPISNQQQKYIGAFLITVILNSFVVLLTTQAREARLFVLPLFFIWPLFTSLFYQDLKLLFSLKNYFSTFKNWRSIVLFIFLNSLNYLLSFQLYTPTIGETNENFFNEYLFTFLLIIITHFTLRQSQNSSDKKNNIAPI